MILSVIEKSRGVRSQESEVRIEKSGDLGYIDAGELKKLQDGMGEEPHMIFSNTVHKFKQRKEEIL